MVSFTCDYNEGAHPLILKRLAETNMLQLPGYGEDELCASAREKIRAATDCPEADVYFLVGGTQTNATVIDSMLHSYEAVLSVETGHIAVHESGAVESYGHKVITLPPVDGKMTAQALRSYHSRFYSDGAWPHMAVPGMVYISFPTEYGTLYTRSELEALCEACHEYELTLFIDGARLGYGLASDECDVSLQDLARLCDVFYIGGTKVGALCGEAVVFPRGNAPRNFFTIIKQHGALLAKGRLLGLQFDTLFTDGLYMSISRKAIEAAKAMRSIFKEKGIELYIDSPTNQLFPVLTQEQRDRLDKAGVKYEVWEQRDDGSAVTRFATSWATSMEQVDVLRTAI
jgi:threonine aldolase